MNFVEAKLVQQLPLRVCGQRSRIDSSVARLRHGKNQECHNGKAQENGGLGPHPSTKAMACWQGKEKAK